MNLSPLNKYKKGGRDALAIASSAPPQKRLGRSVTPFLWLMVVSIGQVWQESQHPTTLGTRQRRLRKNTQRVRQKTIGQPIFII